MIVALQGNGPRAKYLQTACDDQISHGFYTKYNTFKRATQVEIIQAFIDLMRKEKLNRSWSFHLSDGAGGY